MKRTTSPRVYTPLPKGAGYGWHPSALMLITDIDVETGVHSSIRYGSLTVTALLAFEHTNLMGNNDE